MWVWTVTARFGPNSKEMKTCLKRVDKALGKFCGKMEKSGMLEGRAIYGALCSAAYTPCKGALALTEQVMISADAEDAGFDSFCPMEHLLFDPDDKVVLSGLAEDAQLILDGNSYIRPHETVALRYHANLMNFPMPSPQSWFSVPIPRFRSVTCLRSR